MKLFANVKRNIAVVVFVASMLVAQSAFAAFGDSKYATGTTALINDLFFWLTVLVIPATGGLFVAYHAWRKQAADGDGSTIIDANKAIRRILIATVVGETAATLITVVTSYYK